MYLRKLRGIDFSKEQHESMLSIAISNLNLLIEWAESCETKKAIVDHIEEQYQEVQSYTNYITGYYSEEIEDSIEDIYRNRHNYTTDQLLYQWNIFVLSKLKSYIELALSEL